MTRGSEMASHSKVKFEGVCAQDDALELLVCDRREAAEGVSACEVAGEGVPGLESTPERVATILMVECGGDKSRCRGVEMG